MPSTRIPDPLQLAPYEPPQRLPVVSGHANRRVAALRSPMPAFVSISRFRQVASSCASTIAPRIAKCPSPSFAEKCRETWP